MSLCFHYFIKVVVVLIPFIDLSILVLSKFNLSLLLWSNQSVALVLSMHFHGVFVEYYFSD